MAKSIKFNNAILCEHAVAGGNNKNTLINVYSGDIVVGDMPATLMFGLYVELAAGAPQFMKVELQFDGKAFAALDVALPGGDEGKSSNLIVPVFQTGIEKDVTFSIVAVAEGFARTTLLRKRIFKGPIPGASSASPPPSGQSRPGAPAS